MLDQREEPSKLWYVVSPCAAAGQTRAFVLEALNVAPGCASIEAVPTLLKSVAVFFIEFPHDFLLTAVQGMFQLDLRCVQETFQLHSGENLGPLERNPR